MPKVTFIIDGEPTVVEFESGKLPYSHHGKPESFLDVAKNLHVPLEHACGGSGARAACHGVIPGGGDKLRQMPGDEGGPLHTARGPAPRPRPGGPAGEPSDGGCELPVGTADV